MLATSNDVIFERANGSGAADGRECEVKFTHLGFAAQPRPA